MNTPKRRFFLANPFDAKSLARLFEQLTGKRVSESEIAEEEAQALLERIVRDDVGPKPRGRR